MGHVRQLRRDVTRNVRHGVHVWRHAVIPVWDQFTQDKVNKSFYVSGTPSAQQMNADCLYVLCACVALALLLCCLPHAQYGGAPDVKALTPDSPLPGVAARILHVLLTYVDTPRTCDDVQTAVDFTLYPLIYYQQKFNQAVPHSERDDVMAELDIFLSRDYSLCAVEYDPDNSIS